MDNTEKPTLNPIIEDKNLQDKNRIMKEIEIEGENKLKETKNLDIDILNKILRDGEDKFHVQMGRKMTYQEMRMMFG